MTSPATIRLFYPRPALDSQQIQVIGLGCQERMAPGLVQRPRGTDDWMLLALPEGGHVGIDSGIICLGEPTLVLWQPLAPQCYGEPGESWRHSWMHLAGPAIARLVSLDGLPVDRPMLGVDLAQVDGCIRNLHSEIAGDQPDPVIAECLVRILLRQIARTVHGRRSPGPAGLLAARRHLEERYAEPVKLAALARLADLSPNHFCTAFKRAFAISPYDFVLRVRLEHARVLLRDSHRSIAAVAKEVGYDDPASFARLVRRRFGCAPSALR